LFAIKRILNIRYNRLKFLCPRGEIISVGNLPRILQIHRFSLVVKPIDGNHGRGITVNVTSYEEALVASKKLRSFQSSDH
jgi:cyanophycin synthetase